MKAVIIADIDAGTINVLTAYVLKKSYVLASIQNKKGDITVAKNTAYIMRSMSDAPNMEFFREVHKKGGVVYCHLDGIDTSSKISCSNPAIKWMFQ